MGPELLRRLAEAQTAQPEWGELTLVDDFQLQVEHALDLANQERALFVDASMSCPAPYEFIRLVPEKDSSYTSHAMHPAALLYVYQQVHHHPPPPSYLLTVRGECFGLGEDLSEAGRRNLEAAYAFLGRLLASASAELWDAWAGSG